jgi:hypothetical protein
MQANYSQLTLRLPTSHLLSYFPLCSLCPLWFVKKQVFFEREGSKVEC